MAAVAYDPGNSLQNSFLSALALGESGGFSDPAYVGYGGSDLSHAPTNDYGFPEWEGRGNSHAAGIFQFQPDTWNEVAGEHGLNFQNPVDQNAGAWYYAQKEYAKDTGGSLIDALAAGDFSSIQKSLKDKWTSAGGSANNPYGLAGALEGGLGSAIGGTGSPADPSGSVASAPTTIFGAIENWFLRGGLIVVGILIVVVALYVLMNNSNVIPSIRSKFA